MSLWVHSVGFSSSRCLVWLHSTFAQLGFRRVCSSQSCSQLNGFSPDDAFVIKMADKSHSLIVGTNLPVLFVRVFWLKSQATPSRLPSRTPRVLGLDSRLLLELISKTTETRGSQALNPWCPEQVHLLTFWLYPIFSVQPCLLVICFWPLIHVAAAPFGFSLAFSAPIF